MSTFEKDKGIMNGKGEKNNNWKENEHPRDDDGKFISISEFRYMKEHPKEGVKPHPTHLYAKKGDLVKYHQLTHSKKIMDTDIENIELKQNPNPKDKRKAFFIPISEQAKLEKFDKEKKNWKLSEDDDKVMKKFRDKPFNK